MFSLRNGLKRKGFADIINPRKEDRVIRVANVIYVLSMKKNLFQFQSL
jgi:hypothetical protein